MKIKKFQEFVKLYEWNIHPDYETLFGKLVKFQGKSETIEGEILRAYSKIAYRYYNDGDLCNKGYGIETCGSAAIFLRDIASREIDGLSDLLDQLFGTFNDEKYEDILGRIGDLIVSYVKTKVDDDNLTPNTNNLDIHDYKQEAEREFGGKPDWYYREDDED